MLFLVNATLVNPKAQLGMDKNAPLALNTVHRVILQDALNVGTHLIIMAVFVSAQIITHSLQMVLVW